MLQVYLGFAGTVTHTSSWAAPAIRRLPPWAGKALSGQTGVTWVSTKTCLGETQFSE